MGYMRAAAIVIWFLRKVRPSELLRYICHLNWLASAVHYVRDSHFGVTSTPYAYNFKVHLSSAKLLLLQYILR